MGLTTRKASQQQTLQRNHTEKLQGESVGKTILSQLKDMAC